MKKMHFKLFNEAGMHLNGRLTYKAAATIVRGEPVKFKVVDETVTDKVTPCTGDTDAAIGVALDGASADDIVTIAILGSFAGTVVVKAAGAISRGAAVNAVGEAAAVGDIVIGRALEAATASGDLIEVAHTVAGYLVDVDTNT